MARPLRIEYDGAWYHVMNRGLEKRAIFRSESDRKKFLESLRDISQMFGIEIHAYSLMDNHYHLLVHTPRSGLGKAMKHLNGTYTQAFNKSLGRDGPLFRGRYKALLIDSNNYLLTVARYIHLNPVTAGLTAAAEEHAWTSHRHYLRPSSAPKWLTTNAVLAHFPNAAQPGRAFHRYVHEGRGGSDHASQDPFSIAKSGILGNEGFREWAYGNFLSEDLKRDADIPKKSKRMRRDPSPSALLNRVAFAFDTQVANLCRGGHRVQNDARAAAAFLMRKKLGLPLDAIAAHLKMKNAAAAQAVHRMQKRLSHDRSLARTVEGIHLDYREIDEAL